MNDFGCSLIFGHPQGPTGARLIAEQIEQLKRRGGGVGLLPVAPQKNNANEAHRIVAGARDILGGNGILYEYRVARHWADMEAIYTCEGVGNINFLVLGRETTGLRAFS